MELFDLEYGLMATASAGQMLNCQEITGLQAGLSVLLSKDKYDKIYFWGKILGQQKDYYIAYGLRDSEFEFPSKSFYYASEDFEFQGLPRLTEEAADRIIELGVDKPFTGIPDSPLVEPKPAEEPPAEGEAAPLKEVDRLSQVVQEVDFDTAAVPKGAYVLNEAQMVIANSDFKGLGLTEAKGLESYVHFRPPTSVAALRALAHTDIMFYSNFLDPLEGDLPKGCWAVRQQASLSLVTLRSLIWPGYVMYHMPGTTKFGGLYFGYAQKNRDLPFLL
mmetsp:Transcript_104634/g.181805  ORF Transcript_104634/g.181805 Transcript_104634/m.181805 type:complete len:276 (-) Transcript_104634:101-928(-)